MNNTLRITLASFLAYFVMSGMLAPIGIVSAPMARHFDRSITDITAGFGWLTTGILVGAAAALFVLERLRLGRVMVALYAAIALAIASFTVADSLWPVRLALGVVGTACGIGLAAAALAIAQTYPPARRASALVATDACFSIAGIVLAATASLAIARQWPWWSAYLVVATAAGLLIVLAASARYPTPTAAADAERRERWPAGVWLCVATLFLYTLAQSTLLFWLPNHLAGSHGVDPARAGLVVERFWTGMLIAQLAVTGVVLYAGARRIATVAVLTTFAGSLPLWHVTDVEALLWLSLAWGIANLGLLKVVLAYATEFLRAASSRVVAMLLLGATAGTAVAPALSSGIVERGSTLVALQFASGCYALMALVFLTAAWQRRRAPG